MNACIGSKSVASRLDDFEPRLPPGWGTKNKNSKKSSKIEFVLGQIGRDFEVLALGIH